MFEKLNRIRDELEKAKQRRAEADAKVKQLEAKLKAAENNQIIADVSAMKLSPEQVSQFLAMLANGQLNVPSAVVEGNASVRIGSEKIEDEELEELLYVENDEEDDDEKTTY